MMRAITSLIFVVLFLAACQQPPESERQAASGRSSEGPAKPDNAAPSAWQLAISPERAIPVYEDFDGLAPVFDHSGDTTYVINFWATWCKPCVEELPFFTKLQEEYSGSKVRVILISLDFKHDLEEKLVPFIRDRQLKPQVMVLLDGNYNDWIDRVDPSWGGAIPATLVYKDRQRRFHGEKFATYAQLEELLASLP